MARLRPFRGLRYTPAAGNLDSLLSPPSFVLTPQERDRYAARNAYGSVMVAQPEGHGDDRSKFVRYARAAARVAEWRREGILVIEPRPAFYRLVQRFGPEPTVRTTLFAVAETGVEIQPVEQGLAGIRDDRLRLLEATRIVFEPTVALFEDPLGGALRSVASAPASAEAGGELDGLSTSFETIDEPGAVAAITEAFEGVVALLADNVEGYEAAAVFPGEKGALLALTSLDDASYVRLSVHRVLRSLPGGKEAVLARLAELFDIEEHHSRNLILHIDRISDAGGFAFGLATEGGLGYLLTPRRPIPGSAAAWLQEQVFGPLFNLGESSPTLAFTDPIQAIRAANEGAAAAFIMPRPARREVQEALRQGFPLPARSAQTYPAVPTGLVYWSMGDDV